MGTEKKVQKVESKISISANKKFAAKCRKENTSKAEVIRDAIHAYIKK